MDELEDFVSKLRRAEAGNLQNDEAMFRNTMFKSILNNQEGDDENNSSSKVLSYDSIIKSKKRSSALLYPSLKRKKHKKPKAKPTAAPPIVPAILLKKKFKKLKTVDYQQLFQKDRKEHDYDASVLKSINAKLNKKQALAKASLLKSQNDLESMLEQSREVIPLDYLFQKKLHAFCAETGTAIITRIFSRVTNNITSQAIAAWKYYVSAHREHERRTASFFINRVVVGHVRGRLVAHKLRQENIMRAEEEEIALKFIITYRKRQALKIEKNFIAYRLRVQRLEELKREKAARYLQKSYRLLHAKLRRIAEIFLQKKLHDSATLIQCHVRRLLALKKTAAARSQKKRLERSKQLLDRAFVIGLGFEHHGAAFVIQQNVRYWLRRRHGRSSRILLRRSRAASVIQRNYVAFIARRSFKATLDKLRSDIPGRVAAAIVIQRRIRGAKMRWEFRAYVALMKKQRRQERIEAKKMKMLQASLNKPVRKKKRLTVISDATKKKASIISGSVASLSGSVASILPPGTRNSVLSLAKTSVISIPGVTSSTKTAAAAAARTETEHENARKFQRAFRRYKTRKTVRRVIVENQKRRRKEALARQNVAAVLIQSHARKFIVRSRIYNQRRQLFSVILIQSVLRMECARRRFNRMKQQNAAARVIQRSYRSNVIRLMKRYLNTRFEIETKASIAIQSLVRRVTGSIRVELLREEARFNNELEVSHNGWHNRYRQKALGLIILRSAEATVSELEITSVYFPLMQRIFKLSGGNSKSGMSKAKFSSLFRDLPSNIESIILKHKKKTISYDDFINLVRAVASKRFSKLRNVSDDDRFIKLVTTFVLKNLTVKDLEAFISTYVEYCIRVLQRMISGVKTRRAAAAFLKTLYDSREAERLLAATIIMQRFARLVLSKAHVRLMMQSVFKKYIDFESKLPYWMNPRTGYATWEKPACFGDKYDVLSEAIPMPDSLVSYAITCSQCIVATATTWCEECGELYCNKCSLYEHSKKRCQHHVLDKIEACTLCNFQLATTYCENVCHEAFCDNCWTNTHSIGQMAISHKGRDIVYKCENVNCNNAARNTCNSCDDIKVCNVCSSWYHDGCLVVSLPFSTIAIKERLDAHREMALSDPAFIAQRKFEKKITASAIRIQRRWKTRKASAAFKKTLEKLKIKRQEEWKASHELKKQKKLLSNILFATPKEEDNEMIKKLGFVTRRKLANKAKSAGISITELVTNGIVLPGTFSVTNGDELVNKAAGKIKKNVDLRISLVPNQTVIRINNVRYTVGSYVEESAFQLSTPYLGEASDGILIFKMEIVLDNVEEEEKEKLASFKEESIKEDSKTEEITRKGDVLDPTYADTYKTGVLLNTSHQEEAPSTEEKVAESSLGYEANEESYYNETPDDYTEAYNNNYENTEYNNADGTTEYEYYNEEYYGNGTATNDSEYYQEDYTAANTTEEAYYQEETYEEANTDSQQQYSNNVWQEYLDEETGSSYYYNTDTGETSWEYPY